MNIAYRYSRALFQQEASKGILEELEKLSRLLVDDIRLFLETCRDGTTPILQRFVAFLLTKGRLTLLPNITKGYRQCLLAKLGISEGELITAVPIDPKVLERLKQKLGNIEIRQKIDPKIIGGAILLVNNKMIDTSIKSKLKGIAHAI